MKRLGPASILLVTILLLGGCDRIGPMLVDVGKATGWPVVQVLAALEGEAPTEQAVRLASLLRAGFSECVSARVSVRGPQVVFDSGLHCRVAVVGHVDLAGHVTFLADGRVAIELTRLRTSSGLQGTATISLSVAAPRPPDQRIVLPSSEIDRPRLWIFRGGSP